MDKKLKQKLENEERNIQKKSELSDFFADKKEKVSLNKEVIFLNPSPKPEREKVKLENLTSKIARGEKQELEDTALKLDMFLNAEEEEVDSSDIEEDYSEDEEISLEEDKVTQIIPQAQEEKEDDIKPDIIIQESGSTKNMPVQEITSAPEIKVDEIKNKKPKHKKKRKTKLLLSITLVLCILAVLGIGAFYFINTETPTIDLKTKEIVVEYGTEIDLNSYIQAYTGELTIITPKEYMNTLGTQIVKYRAQNGLKSVSKELIIHLIDSTPPEFELSTNEITISKEDVANFNCLVFLENNSVKDNYDKYENITISCPKLPENSDGAIINYVLADSSGNETSKQLKVIVK